MIKIVEYYCPACGEWTFIAADSVPFLPGGYFQFTCGNCEIEWMVMLTFRRIEGE